MKLIGIMPVRNEAWVLGLSARVALQWCDELVIQLHACTDESCAIAHAVAQAFPTRVVRHIPEPAETWDEMDNRQQLLTIARRGNATHIAIVDADEILTANLIPVIRQRIELCESTMLTLPLYNLRGSMERYHANGLWGQRIVSVAFKDSPELGWQGDGYHHREPFGRKWAFSSPVGQGAGGVLHLWGANERRLAAKHRLYKITERLRFPNKPVEDIEQMYNMYQTGAPGERPSDWRYNTVPEEWIAPYRELMDKYLHVDAEPWQEAECDRLIALHGRERFAGLSV